MATLWRGVSAAEGGGDGPARVVRGPGAVSANSSTGGQHSTIRACCYAPRTPSSLSDLVPLATPEQYRQREGVRGRFTRAAAAAYLCGIYSGSGRGECGLRGRVRLHVQAAE